MTKSERKSFVSNAKATIKRVGAFCLAALAKGPIALARKWPRLAWMFLSLLTSRTRLETIRHLCGPLIVRSPHDIQLLRWDGTASLELESYEDAARAFQEILTLSNNDAEAVAELKKVADALSARGDFSAAKAISEASLGARPREILPSILLNAMPKSSGAYIAKTLEVGLDFKPKLISPTIFPNQFIDYIRLDEFRTGNQIAHQQLEPAQENIWYLSNFFPKIIIHVRDVRSVLLSWLHHIGGATDPKQLWPNPRNAPPKHYYGKSLPWRIGWMIENNLQVWIAWIEGWLDLEQSVDFPIMVTQYENFVKNNRQFIEEILDFCEIPVDRFVDPNLTPTAELHFRTGKIDEWREVFTEDQIRQASQSVPDRLYERFGWQR